MAREKKEDPPKGAPAWQSTFSDLMNLLLCFFVLLFSMSTVNEEKMEMVVQSFQNTFSVLPNGGTSISEADADLISSGISALEEFDVYFNASTANQGDTENEGNNADSEQTNNGSEGMASGISDGATEEDKDSGESEQSAEEIAEQYQKQELSESEKMAEDIEAKAKQYGLQDVLDVEFNANYVIITLNGALLFDSGEATVRSDAYTIIDKLGLILQGYNSNMIEVEGHTDNVPIKSSKYEDNCVLSMYRAYNVASYLINNCGISPSSITSSGRGEYDPVADNSTPEGRAKNRRVEIKVYNSYSSEAAE